MSRPRNANAPLPPQRERVYWPVPGKPRPPPARGDGNSMKRLIVIAMLLVSLLASPAKAAPADTTGTLSVNGYDRHYLYVVSAAPAPAGGRPLVIFLHGDGGTMCL